MRTRRSFLETVGVGTIAAAAFTAGAAANDGKRGADLFAPLTSGETVPKVRSRATGSATFTANADGTLDYTVTLKNIEDVTQAHIHAAERGSTGGVVAFLLNFAALDGSTGTPQSGTPQDPIVVSGTLSETALVAQLLAAPGEYYVNVHTIENASGEIRGQLRAK